MKRTVAFTIYKTPFGNPTCALDFESGEICEFLRTKWFGTVDVCACNPDESLHRDREGLGYTVPHADCPIWKGAV